MNQDIENTAPQTMDASAANARTQHIDTVNPKIKPSNRGSRALADDFCRLENEIQEQRAEEARIEAARLAELQKIARFD